MANSKKITLELAETPEELEKGLMFRSSLDDNSGMFFKFSGPRVLKFWGMNTYIPLDIAFVNAKNRIVKISEIKPFNVRGVSSEFECVGAIEVNKDFFAKNKINEGDFIKFEDNIVEADTQNRKVTISFEKNK